MGPEPFEAQLVVREYNRWLLGLAFAAGVGAALFALLGSFGMASPEPAIPLAMAAFIGGTALFRRNPGATLLEKRVVVDAESLRVGNRAIPRARIRDAQVVPLKNGEPVVRIWEERRLPVDLVVSGKEQGREILRALGFDASQRVTRFRGSSILMRSWGVRSGLLFVLLPIVYGVLQAFLLEESPELFAAGAKILTVLLFAVGGTLAIPTRIDVGADGVLVRWLGLKRFYPLARIRSVARYEWGMGGNKRAIGAEMTLAGGEIVRLPMGTRQWDDDRSSALVERIHEAMETHARGGVEAAAALLVRRERGVHEWIEELRAIGGGANADLRTAPVSPENLWRIVESHAAEPEERAAAAVALGPSLDDGGKQRLRVAVGTVADEKLRVAMDAAAHEDEAALEDALAGVSNRAAGRT
jgi:hypothetical protein